MYPVLKRHPDHPEPVWVHDMVQDAMLGPEWKVVEDKRKRPKESK